MAKRGFAVEIRGTREIVTFDSKANAKTYAVTMTAWSGGQYRITPVVVADDVQLATFDVA